MSRVWIYMFIHNVTEDIQSHKSKSCGQFIEHRVHKKKIFNKKVPGKNCLDHLRRMDLISTTIFIYIILLLFKFYERIKYKQNICNFFFREFNYHILDILRDYKSGP